MVDRDRFLRLGNPILWGIILTSGVVSTYYFLAMQRSCQKGVCQTNWEHFWDSSPNEIGDTLAGIAGILAFLWIIVTVFLQSQELREQRKEFKKMTKAQEAQVKALQVQAAIFEGEKKARDEARKEKLLDQLLIRLKEQIREYDNGEYSWTLIFDSEIGGVVSVLDLFDSSETQVDILIRKSAIQVATSYKQIKKMAQENSNFNKSSGKIRCMAIWGSVGDILELEAMLSQDQRARIATMKLEEMNRNLERILHLPVWKRQDAETG